MRSLAIFAVVAAVHFVIGVAGTVVALPAAFAWQQGFWTAPGKITLAWMAEILLAPLGWLPLRPDYDYGEIAIVSALFGAAAVALWHGWKAWRARRPAAR